MFILLLVSSPLRNALSTCSGDIRSGQCKGWESRNVEMAKIYSGEKLFLYNVPHNTKSIMYVCMCDSFSLIIVDLGGPCWDVTRLIRSRAGSLESSRLDNGRFRPFVTDVHSIRLGRMQI